MFHGALIDAFTNTAFKGNPAGIVLLETDGDERDADWMQDVAREIGASETGFLVPQDAGEYRLRWFTPATEVQLCGHATLAAAHWLWERGEAAGVLRFDTRSGCLSATRDDSDRTIWLDFPVVPIVSDREPPGWREAFPGAEVAWIGRTEAARDLDRFALLVTDASTLRGLAPDFGRVAKLPCGGAIVTALSDSPETDVLTRYFAPACGVDEDPVTGSAHCTVGWYWSRVLDKSALRARQISLRGGELSLEVAGDRIRVGGHAITIACLNFLA